MLSRNIKQIRLENGMSQHQMARKLGVTQGAVSQWESGRTRPLNTCVRWMGHADAKMILKVYDEVTDARSKSEAKKLNDLLIGSGNGSTDGQ